METKIGLEIGEIIALRTAIPSAQGLSQFTICAETGELLSLFSSPNRNPSA